MEDIRIQHSIYMFPALMAVGALLGTALYFLLPYEPSLTTCVIMSIVSTVLCVSFYRKQNTLLPFIVVLFVSLGLLNASWQIQNIDPQFLPEKYDGERYWVTGQITEVSSSEKRDRVIITSPKIYGLDMPLKNVRISTQKGRFEGFKISDFIAVEAVLHKPSAPEFDGDYNAQQQAYMNKLSATGYVMGDIYKTSWQEGMPPQGYKWQKFRESISERIIGEQTEEGVYSQSRAVMVALLTGKRQFLSGDTYEAFRKSGLAHILAISGLHIGMIGGFAFLLIRLIYAKFVPLSALKYNKKIAAVGAIAIAFFYTMLAGATLPTTRACLMLSLLFLAVLAGRAHVSIRVLAIALLLIVFIWPDSVMTASFQLSFAAVTALILWNAFSERYKSLGAERESIFGKTRIYVRGVLLTSLVAGLATMPIAAYHFQEITLLGFVLNLIAIPLVAFIIMPLGFIALITMPILGDKIILWLMDLGVKLLLKIAEWGGQQDAFHYTLNDTQALILMVPVVSLLLTTIIKGRKKIASLAVIALLGIVAVIIQPSFTKTKLIIADEHVFYINGSSATLLYKVKYSRGTDYLMRKLGINSENLTDSPTTCDSSGCIHWLEGFGRVYVPSSEFVFITADDCTHSDIILVLNATEQQSVENCVANALSIHSSGIMYENATFSPYQHRKSRVWQQ